MTFIDKNSNRRIENLTKYMDIKGLNDNQVTVECGLSQGLLHKARSGRSDLGLRAVEKILSKYQDLSRVYLLTGVGDMFTEDKKDALLSNSNDDEIPVIPANLYMQSNMDIWEVIHDSPTVRTSPVVRQFSDYDVYYVVYGGEMTPYFLPGDKLAISPYPQGEEDSVIDGRAYVIDTRNNGLMLRQLYKEPDGFIARAYNTRYRDEHIKTSQIIRVYRVLGLIRSYV